MGSVVYLPALSRLFCTYFLVCSYKGADLAKIWDEFSIVYKNAQCAPELLQSLGGLQFFDNFHFFWVWRHAIFSNNNSQEWHRLPTQYNLGSFDLNTVCFQLVENFANVGDMIID